MSQSDATLPKVTLYCTTGGSHKEYRLFTTANPEGTFTLFYQNGPIGQVCPPKVKAGPGTLDEITKEFLATRRSKEKGKTPYTEAADGVAYSTTDAAGELSGWQPQLLAEIGAEALEACIASPEWMAEEKKNGERRGVWINHGDVRGMNKKGRWISGLPQSWVDALKRLPDDTILDGEQVGETFHAFDLSRLRGIDLTSRSRTERRKALELLLQDVQDVKAPAIQLLPFETSRSGKLALLDKLSGQGIGTGPGKGVLAEGIVFKRVDAPYDAGGRSSVALKWKFYEAVNCLVLRKNMGRSVALGLLDDFDQVVEVGSVTIPPNQPIPAPRQVQRVRIMHLFEGGSLYGPPVSMYTVSGGLRTDCRLSNVQRVLSRSSVAPMDDSDYDNEEREVQIQRLEAGSIPGESTEEVLDEPDATGCERMRV